MTSRRYRWVAVGDANAFFGLMLDNVANLVVLASILIFVFGFPEDIVYGKMFPGTALGVMFGDLVYTWMAFRLAARTGRDDVTAMPLGLDAPSTIGMAFAVLGPAFLEAKKIMSADEAAIVAWQVGTAAMILIGVFKLGMSFIGGTIQRLLPSAALLGTLAGIGIALLGALQLGELFTEPTVGLLSFGLILYTLVAKIRLPGRVPEVLVAVALSSALFYGLQATGLGLVHWDAPDFSLSVALPMPSLGFLQGMPVAISTYLPVAVPFAVLTVVGGINCTESARLAGDDYDTRSILLTEAFATLIAGLFGGVSQSTPYIGHPAYKAMGGRAAYTLATGLFIGLGGMFGYIPFMAKMLPGPALVPIFVFVAIDIVEQSFIAIPKKYAGAVVVAMLPNICQLVQIILDQANSRLLSSAIDPLGVIADTHLPASFIERFGVFVMLAHGFILTGMLWGAFVAFLVDRRGAAAAGTLFVSAALAYFGVIHSVLPTGGVYLPWNIVSAWPIHWAAAYSLLGVVVLALSQTASFNAPPEEVHA